MRNAIEWQMTMARSVKVEEREALVQSTEIVPEVIDYMVDNEPYLTIRKGLFRRANSSVWTNTLSKAAKKETDDYILARIALHLNTDADTLDFLSNNKENYVKWAVASNPNTRKDTLDKLFEVGSFEIANAILLNPNVRKETYEKILDSYKGKLFNMESFYDYNKIKIVASGN